MASRENGPPRNRLTSGSPQRSRARGKSLIDHWRKPRRGVRRNSPALPGVALFAVASWRRLCGRLVETNHLRARRLFKREFIIRQRLVKLQFHDGQGDVVLLLRTPDFDDRGEVHSTEVFVRLVMNVADQIASWVIDKLPVRQQISAAEENLARQEPAVLAPADDINFIIGLLEVVTFCIPDYLRAVLHYRYFVLLINRRQQQGIVNLLRA